MLGGYGELDDMTSCQARNVYTRRNCLKNLEKHGKPWLVYYDTPPGVVALLVREVGHVVSCNDVIFRFAWPAGRRGKALASQRVAAKPGLLRKTSGPARRLDFAVILPNRPTHFHNGGDGKRCVVDSQRKPRRDFATT